MEKDSLAARRVEIAVVTFDSAVNVVQNFVTVDQFSPPTLNASGSTDMAGGINVALDLVQRRKEDYRSNHVLYYRPWVFMITDGAPNSGYESAAMRLQEEEKRGGIAFFAVGVQGADMERLKLISVRAPVMLNGLNFKDLFVWLSASLKGVSNSKVGEMVPLPPAGWGMV